MTVMKNPLLTAIYPSHVAVLVPSVRKAAEYLSRFDFQIDKEEEWEGEGTREIYVERDKANSLLLMEPIRPGAYQRAMEKRGPGLHHFAIDVPNIEVYLESLTGSGWFLHPISIKTLKKTQTAYLVRPGFPALIEVQERKELSKRSLFVVEVGIPMEPDFSSLTGCLGLSSIVRQSSGDVMLSLAGNAIVLKELLL